MNYFQRIIKYAKPYQRFGLLNILFNILYALFSTLAMVSLFPMLNVLFGETSVQNNPPQWSGIGKLMEYLEGYLSYFLTQYTTDPQEALMYMVGLVIFMFFLKNLFGYLALYYITFLRNGVLKDLRNALYEKITTLPIGHYTEKRKGDTMARISADVLEIQHSFLSILELIIREPLTILFTIITMVLISLKLTIFVFLFLPLSGYFISLIGKSLKKSSQSVQNEQGHFLSLIEETLSGLKIIKGFTAERIFIQKFQQSTQRFFEFSNNLLNRQNLASPASEFLGIAVIGILLWFGGQMVLIEKTLAPEIFITYMGLAYQILTPAKAISKASYNLKKGNAAAERVLEILETENQIEDKPDALIKNQFTSEIVFKNVSFRYEKEWILRDFNLTVKKGQMVALVGQSGSGKSTVANLVGRFYEVTDGSILIDGIPITDITKKSLRNLMGLVTQDSILFNDTVYNNLKLGKPEATQEETTHAAHIANAYGFINELPHGFDSTVGEGGGKLSGGQKQRLSIARAVLKNPPIMILDEATSALDTESEKLVQDALDKMMHNRTSLVIAHRLSTIQKADVIVVMSKGKIIEKGTHEELMTLQGEYNKLVQLQNLG